jgi:hypothetical protein
MISECAARRPIRLPPIKPAMTARVARTLFNLVTEKNMRMIDPGARFQGFSTLNPPA